MQIVEKIKDLAKGRFEKDLVEEFISTFQKLVGSSQVLGSFLQISTDEGDELEMGFFTANMIGDVTLSRGKVYFCTYPLLKIRELGISDNGSKWTLTIHGEKKFDYNIVKPESAELLRHYENQLRQNIHLFAENETFSFVTSDNDSQN